MSWVQMHRGTRKAEMFFPLDQGHSVVILASSLPRLTRLQFQAPIWTVLLDVSLTP